MIEGGGLGVFRPEEIGPIDVQAPNGVVDVARRRRGRGGARSPSSTCRTSRARSTDWTCADQRRLRRARPGEPAARLRRARGDRRRSPTPARCSSCAATSAAAWSPRWSASRAARSASSPTTRRTSAARSTPTAPTRRRASSSSATRSTCRCCSLCDTPGIMVGPEVEKTALVRHCCRLFVSAPASRCRSSPSCCARATGSARRRWRAAASRRRCFTVAWPTGEFGGMGLEGAVKLGYRKELEAIADPAERARRLRRDGGARLRARQGDQHGVASSRSTT